MEVINNTYHVWSNAKKGRVRSLPGWKPFQEPENFTLEELGLLEGRVSHPFPITNNLSIQPLPSLIWEPFLYARVQIATFRFAGRICWYCIMESSTEEGVGNLHAHDSGYEHEFLGRKGRECCLMAVCEGAAPRWSEFFGDIHFKKGNNYYGYNNLSYPQVTPGTAFKWIDVLWIEWGSRIAYRREAGKIWANA